MQRWWLLLIALLGGGLLLQRLRRGVLHHLAANINEFDVPSAALYDALSTSLMGGFYRRVAQQIATDCPTGYVLEVGGGPGQLAVALAQVAPGLTVVGVDLAPAMVERATRRVMEAGRAGQVQVQVGNVAMLPFPDATFDAVVSTLSLHHWAEPDRGLAEIYRVLKPGKDAWIYDVPDWLSGHARPGRGGLARLAASSPFGAGTVDRVRWPGPIALLQRLRLHRDK